MGHTQSGTESVRFSKAKSESKTSIQRSFGRLPLGLLLAVT